EHLDNRLTDLITREPKHPGEHRDVRIDTRPEPRQRTRRQARERRLLTRRAAQPQPRVLEHQRDDHRQLELLMAHRIADPLLAAIKLTSATAAIRQMPDPAIQPLGRDQLSGLALMPRLTARLPHRPLVCLPRRAPTLSPRRRRIRRRRQAAVTRIAVDLALKLLNPILKPTDHRQQRIYPLRVQRLYVLSQHACKIPCVTQEPCSAPRHPVSPYGDAVSYAVHSTPAHGTISPYRGANLTYTPNPGYSGPDQFSFDATDNHGASTFAVVTLNVAPGPNHAPTCAPQTFSVAHDTATAITLSCTDQDAGDTVSYAVHSTPAHGTISPYRGANLTYTPNPGYSGPDQFSFDRTEKHGAAKYASSPLKLD